MTTTKQRPRKQQGKTVGKAAGETVPLVIPIPGGQAKFYDPAKLTPRRTRELEIIGAEILPRMQEIANAAQVSADGVTPDVSTVLGGPDVRLSRDELRTFMEFQEAAAWAFLESWTLDEPLPASPDDLQDLPRDVYEAITRHAAKLTVATDVGFSIEALGDDLDEADPDLPTYACGASSRRCGQPPASRSACAPPKVSGTRSTWRCGRSAGPTTSTWTPRKTPCSG